MLFHKLFIADHADNLDPSEPAHRTALDVADGFSALVDALSDHENLPLPPINELMKYLWNLVGSGTVKTGVSESVDSIHFYAEVNATNRIAAIVFPANWCQLYQQNFDYQIGGTIYTASKARDFWNNRLQPFQDVERRAQAHEAEYLHYARQGHNDFRPNQYQSSVMQEFPLGLASLDQGLQYEPIPPPPHPHCRH